MHLRFFEIPTKIIKILLDALVDFSGCLEHFRIKLNTFCNLFGIGQYSL